MMKALAILFSLLLWPSWAANAQSIQFDRLVIDCAGPKDLCEKYKEDLGLLPQVYPGPEALKESMKNILYQENIDGFTYGAYQVQGESILYLNLSVKKYVDKIELEGGEEALLDQAKKILGLKEGEFFEHTTMDEDLTSLKRFFMEKGYNRVSVSSSLSNKGSNIQVKYTANLGPPQILKTLRISITDPIYRRNLRKLLMPYVNKPLAPQELKEKIDQYSKDLVNAGYFYSNVQYEIKNDPNSNNATLRITVKLNNRFFFAFYGNNMFTYQELLSSIKEIFVKNRKGPSKEALAKAIGKMYAERGVFQTNINIRIEKLLTRNSFSLYSYIQIQEGIKVRVKEFAFDGARYFPRKALMGFLMDNAGVITKRNFYEETYLSDFVDILTKEYYKRGFLAVKVDGPDVRFTDAGRNAYVRYQISEGTQTKLKKLEMTGGPEGFPESIAAKLTNQEGLPFNPVSLNDDLNTVLTELRALGYYFARIQNLNAEEMVTYSDDLRTVNVRIELEPGKKTYLNEVILAGNIITKNEVIEREITILPGELVHKQKLDEITENLNATNLFSQVNLKLVDQNPNTEKVNLLVSLKEKQFGTFELAPGFRTDIGLKLSTTVGYNNLFGKNKQASVTGAVNRRLNYDTLDARRRGEKKSVLEYALTANYLEPYFLNLPISWNSSVGHIMKRFASFDAEITRGTTTFSKQFGRYIGTAMSYQLESITQSDATDKTNNGYFRIGSLTPSVTFDLRNNRINPTSGAYFSISTEFANPYFYSLKEKEREIDFYKLIFRNRFYIPLPFGVLALSYSMGKQENRAKSIVIDSAGKSTTKGFIPSIKVFRLNGIDLVRGFNDDEINRLDSGVDIYNTTVRNTAYFSNIKIEPRYFVNDNFILGLFMDAGKVSVDHFKPMELRTSAGLSFKYLTPVGTLDFDYGFKLQRKRLSDGKLETPGRFHISIGFF